MCSFLLDLFPPKGILIKVVLLHSEIYSLTDILETKQKCNPFHQKCKLNLSWDGLVFYLYYIYLLENLLIFLLDLGCMGVNFLFKKKKKRKKKIS